MREKDHTKELKDLRAYLDEQASKGRIGVGIIDKIVNAVATANQKYKRYINDPLSCDYGKQIYELGNYSLMANNLWNEIDNLSLMGQDKLKAIVGEETIWRLKDCIEKICDGVENEPDKITQRRGRPVNLPMKSWVHEIADIYENEFKRSPKISGSGDSEDKDRGPFWAFLQRCREIPSIPQPNSTTVTRYLNTREERRKTRASQRSPRI